MINEDEAFIYIIGCCDEDWHRPPYKVGRSNNPFSRLANLQCGSPVELCLAAVWKTTGVAAVNLERAFHDRRRGNPGWRRGEWYDIPYEAVVDDVYNIIQASSRFLMIERIGGAE